MPTGVSGHISLSAGQTEGEGVGVGTEDEDKETVLELMVVTEEETTGVGDVIEVAEFCTVMRVTFSTACRGKPVLLPVKSLAVGRRSEKQLPETLVIPSVRVQSGL